MTNDNKCKESVVYGMCSKYIIIYMILYYFVKEWRIMETNEILKCFAGSQGSVTRSLLITENHTCSTLS